MRGSHQFDEPDSALQEYLEFLDGHSVLALYATFTELIKVSPRCFSILAYNAMISLVKYAQEESKQLKAVN